MKLSFSKSYLKAASRCMAKSDIRYFLSGVYVEYGPLPIGGGEAGGTVIVVATTGHVLFAGKTPAAWIDGDGKESFSVIVPDSAVKLAVKGKGANVELELMPDGRFAIEGQVFTPIGAKYPDFSRVIPSTVSGEKGYFNPEYLALGQDALRDVFGKGAFPTLEHNGTSVAAMHCGTDDCVFAVMPMTKGTHEYKGFTVPHVRPARKHGGKWAIARLTPASDELPGTGSDRAIVASIRKEFA